MKHKTFLIPILAIILTGCTGGEIDKKAIPVPGQEQRYEPNWSSLSKHEVPQWLKDAKFGIYTHISVGGMKNIPGNEKKWDHELIEYLTLENFDAAEWATLFEKAGARFAGPVAWHNSGFLNWDSDLTEFDMMDMGPGIDLSGELKREIEARGIKFMMSFHNGYWYGRPRNRKNPEIMNPAYEDLYGPPHDDDVPVDQMSGKRRMEGQSKPSAEHSEALLAKMNEAVTKYEPDLIWVDYRFAGTLRPHNQGRTKDGKLLEGDIYLGGIAEHYQREFLAHLYNTAETRGKEAEFVYKAHDVPPGIGIRNIENGLIDELAYDIWMTDIDISLPTSWFYKEGMGIRDANNIVDILVDVTSKNGILLLNVPPKPDGTFAENIVQELLEVGSWLDVNGEAIYGTIPWILFGEGPSYLQKTGHYSEGRVNAVYTQKDFRFTQKDHALYAICLGVPEGDVSIRALGNRGRLYEGDILSINLLGSGEEIQYSHDPDELKILMPENFKGSKACVFKINRRR